MGGMVVLEVEGGGGRRKSALLVGLPSSALSLSLSDEEEEGKG